MKTNWLADELEGTIMHDSYVMTDDEALSNNGICEATGPSCTLGRAMQV